MYKIIYMKADFEPWWQFEGWESTIISIKAFDSEHQFELALQEILTEFRLAYGSEQSKDGKFFAFWNEDECEYCEACDEDAQWYHGIIVEHPVISKSSVSN